MLGSVLLPIEVEGKSVLLECLVVPEIPQGVILGIDFLTKTGIEDEVVVFSAGTRTVGGKANLSELGERESRALGHLIAGAFQAMPQGLGRTYLVEHRISVKAGVEPVKQRVSPVK